MAETAAPARSLVCVSCTSTLHVLLQRLLSVTELLSFLQNVKEFLKGDGNTST